MNGDKQDQTVWWPQAAVQSEEFKGKLVQLFAHAMTLLANHV